MTPAFLILTSTLALLQIVLPKRIAFLPLIIATLHLGNIELFTNLTPCRLLIVIGLTRAATKGWLNWSARNKIDLYFLAFSIIALLVSLAPRLDITSPFNQNAGLILNIFGTYLYGRAYLTDNSAFTRFAACLSIALIPLAIGLSYERATRQNAYNILGSRHEFSMMRLDKTRASGPFQHPILAGTAGAVSLPLMFALWREHRKKAIMGLFACLLITISSNSSGPLMSCITAIAAMSLWFLRHKISSIHRWGWVTAILLHLISTRGIWYLMARIDLTGGSTGFHRAKLIDNAFSDLDRWWLAGTDYTRNWMFSGVTWSPRHTDITNYYIHLGVIGGLALTILLVLFLYQSFSYIGNTLKASNYEATSDNLQSWCIGASLFSHAITMLSVSYFDQIYALFYLTIAIASSLSKNIEKQPYEENRHNHQTLRS